MLKTITLANFEYRGHTVTALRMIDTLTDKFFCWQGRFDDNEFVWVVGKTIDAFEKNFIALADKVEDGAGVDNEQTEFYGIKPSEGGENNE